MQSEDDADENESSKNASSWQNISTFIYFKESFFQGDE